LGHEISAEVVELGEGVIDLKPGDSVVVEDCSMCGTCFNCKAGRPDLCRNMYGLNSYPGMGQYLCVRYNNLVKFDGMSHIDACLAEPLAVALNAVINSQIPLNGSVAVLGCGPLGIMAAKVAKLYGAGFVAITEIDTQSSVGKARVDLARKMEIDMIIDAKEQDIEGIIKSKFPKGVDRVIVSSPPESIYDALRIIGYGGTITFFGLHFGGRNKINIDINHLIFNKITLRPFFAEPAINFKLSLDLLKKGLIPAKDLITHQFRFSDARLILSAIVNGTEPIIKAVMLPNS
jgi:L-iditol 2-dehydrogenase